MIIENNLVDFNEEKVKHFLGSQKAHDILFAFGFIDYHISRECIEELPNPELFYWGKGVVGQEMNNLGFFVVKKRDLFDKTCYVVESEFEPQIKFRKLPFGCNETSVSRDEILGFYLNEPTTQISNFDIHRMDDSFFKSGRNVYIPKNRLLQGEIPVEETLFQKWASDETHFDGFLGEPSVSSYYRLNVDGVIEDWFSKTIDENENPSDLEIEFKKLHDFSCSLKALYHNYFSDYVTKFGINHETIQEAIINIYHEGSKNESKYVMPLEVISKRLEGRIENFMSNLKDIALFQFGVEREDYLGEFTTIMRASKFVEFNWLFNPEFKLKNIPKLFRLAKKLMN